MVRIGRARATRYGLRRRVTHLDASELPVFEIDEEGRVRDGGRLVFVLLEWVRRGKRISPRREGIVHLVGFAALIGFVFFMSYFDIVRIVSGESLIR